MQPKFANAASLPLDQLQSMSRGDLMQASNLLHAAWSQERQKVASSARNETRALQQLESLKSSLQEAEGAFEAEVRRLTMALGASEGQLRKVQQEYFRLKSLADDTLLQETLKRPLRVTILDPTEAVSVAASEEVVSLKLSELDELLQANKSSAFRLRDLEDRLQIAQGDLVMLERQVRQSRSVDTVVLEGDLKHEQEISQKHRAEVLELRETVALLESNLKTANDELHHLRSVLDRNFEATMAADEANAHGRDLTGGAGSMLSSVSWSTANPGSMRRRMRNMTENGARLMPSATHQNYDDDFFGVSLTVTTATQTDNLVLQNVELLYKLQRDLADLRQQRTTLESEARKGDEERQRLLDRVSNLENQLSEKMATIESLAGRSRSVPPMPGLIIGAPGGLRRGGSNSTLDALAQLEGSSFASQPDDSRIHTLTRKCTEHECTISVLRETVDDLRKQLGEWIAKADSAESTATQQLISKSNTYEETISHLNDELSKLSRINETLYQENVTMRLLVGVREGAPLSEVVTNQNGKIVLAASESERSACEKEIKAVRDEAAAERAAAAQRTAALEVECEELRVQAEKRQGLILGLMSEKGAVMQEIANLTQNIGELQREARSLRNALRASWAAYHSFHSAVVDISTEATLVKLQYLFRCMTPGCDGVNRAIDTATARRELVSARVEEVLALRSGSFAEDGTRLRSSALPSRSTSVALSEDSFSAAPLHFSAVPLERDVRLSLVDIASGAPLPSAMHEGHASAAPHTVPPLTYATEAESSSTKMSLRDLGDSDKEDADSAVSFQQTPATALWASESLGLQFVEHFGAVIIDDVWHDSSAYLAGLKASDCILSVDGTVVNSLREVAAALRGKSGSTCLTVIPGGGRELLRSGSLAADAEAHVEEIVLSFR